MGLKNLNTVQLVNLSADPSSGSVGDLYFNTTAGQVKVCTNATGPVWSTMGGSGVWGSITGTLSSQTDLQTALNAKASLTGATFTGTLVLDKPVNWMHLTSAGVVQWAIYAPSTGNLGFWNPNGITLTLNSDRTSVFASTVTSTGFIKSGGTSSQFLKADGSVDSNAYAVSLHNHSLDTLTNVTVSSKASGDVLKWNGSAWVNSTLAGAGIQPAGSYLTANQSITLSGDASGTGTTAITVTLSNSGVTAGTYTSVTVDAKGRVTGGTNPGYITNTDANIMANRGSVAEASIDTAISNGFYTVSRTSDSCALLTFNAAGSSGPTQFYTDYTGLLKFRNKTDSTTWNAWKTVVHSANLSSYALPIGGGTLTGSLTVSGNVIANAIGVGLSSPAGLVHVHGTWSGNTSDMQIIASGSSLGGINLRTNTAGRFSIITNYTNANFTSFLTGTGTANPSTVLMQFDHTNGRVGINTNTPGTALDVNGTATATTFVKSGGTSSQFLKADGSVDSTSYFHGGLSYVDFSPTTVNIRITSGPGTFNIGDDDIVSLAGGAVTVTPSGRIASGNAAFSTYAYATGQGDNKTHFGYYNGTGYNNYIRGAVTYVNGILDGDTLRQGGNQVLHAANYGTYAVPRSEYRHFGTVTVNPNAGDTTCTTAQFISWLTTLGAFNYTHSVMKCAWSYAGNNDISDTGLTGLGSNFELAGSVIEVFTDGSYYTIRIVRPTTGAMAGAEFIYNYQGTSYAPGWRQVWNSSTLTNLNQLTNGPGYITSSGSISGSAGSASQVYQYTDPSSSTYRIMLGNGTNANGALYNKSGLYWRDSDSTIVGANITGSSSNADTVDNIHGANIVAGTGSSTWGKRTTGLSGDSRQGLSSGFYDGNGLSNMPTTDWYHLIVSAHNNSFSGNQYEFHIATSFWSKTDFYMRTNSPNDPGPWRKLIHDGNIGSQSVSYASSAGNASNADTVDNIHSSNLEYRHTTGEPRNNLGDPTVREMALFDAQFNNKTEFYDITKMYVETSTDNVNWTTYSVTDANKRLLLGGDNFSGLSIPYGTPYFRIRFRANSYVFLNAIYGYWSANGHQTKVKVYKKHDSDPAFIQVAGSDTLVSSWPGHLYLPHDTIPFISSGGTPGGHAQEVYVLFIPSWNATYSSNVINLFKLQWWGGYPAGKRNLYSTDEWGSATFPANVTTTGTSYAHVFSDADGYNTSGSLSMNSDGTYYGTIGRVGTQIWSLGLNASVGSGAITPVLSWTGAGTVGIGTTTPAAGLHVNSDTGVRVSRASNTDQYLALTGGDGGGLAGVSAAYQLALSTGGVERVRVNGSGKVGIGTSSPGEMLDVNGTINIRGTYALQFGNYGGQLWMIDTTWIRTGNSIWTNDGVLGSNRGLTVGYGGTFPPSSGGAIIAGNVGIGTSNPLYKLDVAGNASFSGWIYSNSISNYGTVSSASTTTNANPGGAAFEVREYNRGTTTNGTGIGYAPSIGFHWGAVGWGHLTMNSSTELCWMSYDRSAYLPFKASAGTFTSSVTTPVISMSRYAGAGVGLKWYSPGYTAWQEYMAPATTGQGADANLTAPSGTNVYSWALRSFVESAAGYGWTWESGTNSSTTPSLIAELSSNTGNFRTVGSIQGTCLGVGTAPSGTTGEIRATNNVTAYYSSDRRLKRNITPITNAVDRVKAINGVEFDWTDEYVEDHGGEDGYFIRRHDVGVIAQEVQEVLPEVVAERPDGTLAVRYEKMVALLIEAVKEQQARIDELERRLNGSEQ